MPAESPRPQAPPADILQRARILVADDQPDVLQALRLLLKGEGCDIETATAPAGVLSAVEARDFDVALIVVFESKAAHDAYQEAPLHLKFIAENRETWAKVRVFDATFGGGE